jgi:hypothetical protein
MRAGRGVIGHRSETRTAGLALRKTSCGRRGLTKLFRLLKGIAPGFDQRAIKSGYAVGAIFRDELLVDLRLAVQAIEIAGDAAEESLGDALALASFEQQAFIAGIAYERNFREDRGHVGPG